MNALHRIDRMLTGNKRYINLIPAVNFSFVLQISCEAAAVTFQFALSNGGPASIVYGSIFSGIGTTLVALSLAEMASMCVWSFLEKLDRKTHHTQGSNRRSTVPLVCYFRTQVEKVFWPDARCAQSP